MHIVHVSNLNLTSLSSDCLSCRLLRMLCSHPPFFPDKDKKDMIIKGRYCKSSPSYKKLSDLAKDLLARIFEVDPAARMSINDILSHKWMKGMASDVDMGESYSSLVSRLALRHKLCKILFRNLPPVLDALPVSSLDSTDEVVHPSRELDDRPTAIARHYFNIIDTNRDNKISREELREGLSRLLVDDDEGLGLRELLLLDGAVCPGVLENIDEVFDVMDRNGDSYIELDEFKEFCECLALPPPARLSEYGSTRLSFCLPVESHRPELSGALCGNEATELQVAAPAPSDSESANRGRPFEADDLVALTNRSVRRRMS